MPRASNGVYTLPAGNPVVTGTTITSTWANTTMSDLASEMTNSLDRQGRGSMLAAFKSTDGSTAAPGMVFGAETTTGFSRPAAGVLAVSILAAEVARFTAAGFTGNIVGPIRIAAGSVGAPSYSFTGDTDTGMWSAGADIITWSNGGVASMQLGASQLTLSSPYVFAPHLGAVGAPSYAFNGDLNTGMWSPAADTLALSTAGAERLRIGSAGNFTISAPTSGVTLIASALAGGQLFSLTDGTITSRLTFAGSRLTFGVTSAHTLDLETGGNARISILSTGEVGVNSSSPNAQLVVRGTGAAGHIAGTRNTLYLLNSNGAGNQSNTIVFGSAGAASSAIILNDVAADGTTVNTLSYLLAGSERYRMTTTALQPAIDATHDLGTTSLQWSVVYATQMNRNSAGALTISASNAGGSIDFRQGGASRADITTAGV